MTRKILILLFGLFLCLHSLGQKFPSQLAYVMPNLYYFKPQNAFPNYNLPQFLKLEALLIIGQSSTLAPSCIWLVQASVSEAVQMPRSGQLGRLWCLCDGDRAALQGGNARH